MEQNRKIELLKNYLDIEITHDVNDMTNVDCNIYNESSADGYDLYIVTNNLRQPIICEDVYYYDHDLTDRFEDQMAIFRDLWYSFSRIQIIQFCIFCTWFSIWKFLGI